MARRRPIWRPGVNVFSSPGVEPLQRRGPDQGTRVVTELEPEDPNGGWVDVDPQPSLMVVIIDEADPHANQRDSFSGQYGVLYVARDDDVRDKDRFWFQPPGGQRFAWGLVGTGRWDIPHALTGVNFGVKQFRIRRGG